MFKHDNNELQRTPRKRATFVFLFLASITSGNGLAQSPNFSETEKRNLAIQMLEKIDREARSDRIDCGVLPNDALRTPLAEISDWAAIECTTRGQILRGNADHLLLGFFGMNGIALFDCSGARPAEHNYITSIDVDSFSKERSSGLLERIRRPPAPAHLSHIESAEADLRINRANGCQHQFYIVKMTNGDLQFGGISKRNGQYIPFFMLLKRADFVNRMMAR